MKTKDFIELYFLELSKKNWTNILFIFFVKILSLFTFCFSIHLFREKFVFHPLFQNINDNSRFYILLIIFGVIDFLLKFYFKKVHKVLPFFRIFRYGNRFEYFVISLRDFFSLRNLYLIPIAFSLGLDISFVQYLSIYLLMLNNSYFSYFTYYKTTFFLYYSVLAIFLAFIYLWHLNQLSIVYLIVCQSTLLCYFLFKHRRFYYYLNESGKFLKVNNLLFNSQFLSLDFWFLFSNRSLLITLLRSLVLSGMYFFLYYKSGSKSLANFDYIFISIYISGLALGLLPVLLSVNWRIYSLLYTLPNFQKFYEVKFNYLSLVQVLLIAPLLYITPISRFLEIISISLFQIFFTTPLIFLSVYFNNTETLIESNNTSIFAGVPSINQTIYLLIVFGFSCFILNNLMGFFPNSYQIMLFAYVSLFILFKKQIFYWITFINLKKKYYIYSKIKIDND